MVVLSVGECYKLTMHSDDGKSWVILHIRNDFAMVHIVLSSLRIDKIYHTIYNFIIANRIE